MDAEQGEYPALAAAQVTASDATPPAKWTIGGTAPMLVMTCLLDVVAALVQLVVTAARQPGQPGIGSRLGNAEGAFRHGDNIEKAGLVLLGKRPTDRDAYHALFRQEHIHKTYHAAAPFRGELTWPLIHTSRLVRGALFFRMQEMPGDANSETCIRLLRTDGSRVLYQLEPGSGKYLAS